MNKAKPFVHSIRHTNIRHIELRAIISLKYYTVALLFPVSDFISANKLKYGISYWLLVIDFNLALVLSNVQLY